MTALPPEAAGWSRAERSLATALLDGWPVVVNVRKSGPHHNLVPWLVETGRLRYVGHATTWTEIVYRYGKPEQKDFLAFYVADNKLLAATSLKHNRDLDAIEFLLQSRKSLTKAQMTDKSFDLPAYAVTA